MVKRKFYLFIFIIPLVLSVSCLHTRAASSEITVGRSISIVSGSAVLRINGRINENIYSGSRFWSADERNSDFYDNPYIHEGTVTKDLTMTLTAGQEYSFSVFPSEVVVINIRSIDENDVIVSYREGGRDRTVTVEGTNRLGQFIAFQNR